MKIIDFSCAIGYQTLNYEVVNRENLIVREKVSRRDTEELLA